MTHGSAPAAARAAPSLTIIVPCFNEEDVLRETARRLQILLDKLVASGDIAGGGSVLFVDDGSTDSTWDLIALLAAEQGHVRGLKLARNFGHQNALLAGLLASDADVTVTIDADLQDPPDAIVEMISAYRAGADIVCGVRDDRSADSFLKRKSAGLFYRLMQGLGVDLIAEHADFRLMSRAATDALRQFGETNLFLRGLIPQLGFRRKNVFYRRDPRLAGYTKYNLARMLSLSASGITAFSLAPLRLIAGTGLVISLLAFAAGLWALLAWSFGNATVSGWTSIVIPLYFLGGLQLLSLGIIGEYLGKNYLETKRRPRFIIERSI